MIKENLVDLVDEIVEKRKYSNIQLNYYFKIKGYNDKEKAFVNNLLNVTLKNLIYIDYIISCLAKNISKKNIKNLLRISIAQILFMDSDNKGVVYEAVEIAKKTNVQQGKFVNSLLRNMILNIDKINDNISVYKKEGILNSYPQWIVDKLKIDFNDEYLDIMKSYKKRSYLSVRINKNKISKEEFLELLNKIGTNVLYNVLDVFYLSNNNIFKTKEFLNGDVVIQDGSSFIVAYNVKAKETDIVLDACAAPGGKSLAILQLYNPKKLVATDIHTHKIDILNDLKVKYGYDNLVPMLNDASSCNLGMSFDKILLDVPCSGLGVLRKKPEKLYTLTSSNIKSLKKTQKKIFDNNYKLLKENGEIIYSTCTFLTNENTNNVKYFLEKYDDLEVLDLDIPENVEYTKDEFGGVYINYKNEYLDGFYIVKFKKK